MLESKNARVAYLRSLLKAMYQRELRLQDERNKTKIKIAQIEYELEGLMGEDDG